jgi:hypothetical protein
LNIRRRNRDLGLVSQVINLDGKNAKYISRRFIAKGGGSDSWFAGELRKTKLYLANVCSAGRNDHWSCGRTDEGVSDMDIRLTILFFHVLLSYLPCGWSRKKSSRIDKASEAILALQPVTFPERFKDEIKPMDKASEAILALEPVTFRYKHELDPEGIPQFGLVAEQVEKVNPDLVARDAEGKVNTVRYDAVNAMLLNDFLKEHHKVEQQQNEIDALKAELKEQRAFIQRVSDKVEMNRPASQITLNDQIEN